MNWDQVKGKWTQAKGEAKKQWGKLSDDTLTEIDGDKDKLVGKIQETYGVTKEEAEKQVDAWHKSDSYQKMHASWENAKASASDAMDNLKSRFSSDDAQSTKDSNEA